MTSIVDDYAAIARRMRGEPDPIQEQCPTCWGRGYIESPNPAEGMADISTCVGCPDCQNPEGKLAP